MANDIGSYSVSQTPSDFVEYVGSVDDEEDERYSALPHSNQSQVIEISPSSHREDEVVEIEIGV